MAMAPIVVVIVRGFVDVVIAMGLLVMTVVAWQERPSAVLSRWRWS